MHGAGAQHICMGQVISSGKSGPLSRVCMYVCVCIYICVCVCVCVYVSVNICTDKIYMYICIYTCVYLRT
jgi:hypothetical protein